MTSTLKLLLSGLFIAGSAISMLPSSVDAAGTRRGSREPNYYCYVEAQNGTILNLESMCSHGNTVSEAESGASSSSSSSEAAPSGSSAGNCETPDDIAPNGSRCGERAASSRTGGR